MSDIVERLRHERRPGHGSLQLEAADEIERLQQQVEYWQSIAALRGRENIRAATIEECAQWLDRVEEPVLADQMRKVLAKGPQKC